MAPAFKKQKQSTDLQTLLWVRLPFRARCTTLCDTVCQWLVTDRWFSPGTPVSSTNKTDRHDITEILLKVALNTNKKWTFSKSKNCIANCKLKSWWRWHQHSKNKNNPLIFKRWLKSDYDKVKTPKYFWPRNFIKVKVYWLWLVIQCMFSLFVFYKS
jgi:hypothetical protein